MAPISPLYATKTLDLSHHPVCNRVITYAFNDPLKKPRFGDNLVAFVRALYLAYLYKLPLACKPFPGFKELEIARMIGLEVNGVKLLNSDDINQKVLTDLHHYDKIDEFLRYHGLGPELHIVSYGPYDSPYDYKNFRDKNGHPFFKVPIDKDNKGFIELLNKLIDPKEPYPAIVIPCQISVALHFRTGGSFDTPEVKAQYRDKYSDFTFYTQQLHSIWTKHGAEVYCHLFTDDNPKELIERSLSNFSSLCFLNFNLDLHLVPHQCRIFLGWPNKNGLILSGPTPSFQPWQDFLDSLSMRSNKIYHCSKKTS